MANKAKKLSVGAANMKTVGKIYGPDNAELVLKTIASAGGFGFFSPAELKTVDLAINKNNLSEIQKAVDALNI